MKYIYIFLMRYNVNTISDFMSLIMYVYIFRFPRFIAFKQSTWLKSYIDYNTIQRSRCTDEFGKSFFKLMNNSMFGKTMENLRNRRTINIVNNETSLRRFTAQPTFKGITIFKENLVAIE